MKPRIIILIFVCVWLIFCPSAFPQSKFGYDFRNSAPYVSDPTNLDPVLGEAYPHVYTHSPGNAGWEVDSTNCNGGPRPVDSRSANDARLAGSNFVNNFDSNRHQCTFRVTGTAGNTYKISAAFGRASGLSFPFDLYVVFKDNGVPIPGMTFTRFLVPLNSQSGNAQGGEFMDAVGNIFNQVNWPTLNVGKVWTFTGDLEVTIGPNAATDVTDSTSEIANLTLDPTGSPLVAPFITSDSIPPAVQAGQTHQFTASQCGSGCTWSVSGSSAGSINSSTGVYTAPGTIIAKHQLGGWQLLPNDHLYNTRIDSLPVDPNQGTSASITATCLGTTGGGACASFGAANTAVYTFGAAHGYSVNQPFAATGCTNSGTTFDINGGNIASVPDSTHITVAITHADVASAAETCTGWNLLRGAAGFFSLIYQSMMPYNHVDSTTPLINMSFKNTPTSNTVLTNTLFQIPSYPARRIESGTLMPLNATTYDNHMVMVDTGNGNIQETYRYYPLGLEAHITNTCLGSTCSPGGAANTAVFTTSVAHNFVAGSSYVSILNTTNGSGAFNSNPVCASVVVASVPDSTHFTIALTHADIGTAADTGTAYNEPINGFGAACRAQSGIRYAWSSYTLPTGNATDAAGLQIAPLTLHLQEVLKCVLTGCVPSHALRFTMTTGHDCNCYRWPATIYAGGGAGKNPYGQLWRLKASVDCSALSITAQVLCNQLKQYGIRLADIGTNGGILYDYDAWPQSFLTAVRELGTFLNSFSNQFDPVDDTSLLVSEGSGITTASETVIATASNGAQTKMGVVLQGVAIDVKSPVFNTQAGAPATQLTAYISGSSNLGVNWTMSPTVGTLTNGGLYTPPATLTAMAITTITATSAADSTAVAYIAATVFPNGAIRILAGQPGTRYVTSASVNGSNVATLNLSGVPGNTTRTPVYWGAGTPGCVVAGFQGADNYFNGTFSLSSASANSTPDTGTASYSLTHGAASATIHGTENITCQFVDSQGFTWYGLVGHDSAEQFDNDGGTWPAVTDVVKYKVSNFGNRTSGNDVRYDFTVQPGIYNITIGAGSTAGVNNDFTTYEANGQIYYQMQDIFTQSGGVRTPIDYTLLNVSVPASGQLSFVARRTDDGSGISGRSHEILIGYIKITPVQPSASIGAAF